MKVGEGFHGFTAKDVKNAETRKPIGCLCDLGGLCGEP
jgi:hypothetical protein